MKKIFFMLMLLPMLGFSQDVNKIGEKLYRINKEGLQKLENYHKRYIQCDSSVSKIEAQVDILIENHHAKDRIMISMQKEILNKANEINEIKLINSSCRLELNEIKLNLVDAKKTIKKQKRQTLKYKILSGILAGTSIYFLAK